MKAEPVDPGKAPGPGPGLVSREIRTCEACGTKFSATRERVLCPVCVLLGALGEEAASAGSSDPGSGLERGPAEAEAAARVGRFAHYQVMLDGQGEPIELGRGAMGITYKGFDVDLRVPVTLKVINERCLGDESARRRFLREARAAAKVRHPNVASVFHLGRSRGEYFYAMEFFEGETLESLIKRSGRLEVKRALEIVSQVAAGLTAVHEQNLVHRDIKPTNIMVCLKDGGRVTAKIIDLGLAKGVGEPGSESAISTAGAFAGTPAFASPEQFAGVGLDIRSDLYSLGVMLWEMLVGRTPFCGSHAEVMYQHQHTHLPLEQLKGLPQPVVVLLEVLLEKDPAQRIQGPVELLNTLPTVTGAIDARRSVNKQYLRSIPARRLTGFQKTANFPGGIGALLASSRVRLLVWLMTALLIAGTVVLAVNGLFLGWRPATESRVTPSASITAPVMSIAVLPFETLSENKGDTYFADGVQDEILSKLARISQLKVISRTSVMAYRLPGNHDLRSIGAALGVANVVEGTVQRDGNRVRVTTELIDARTDKTLWSESYQRDLTDIFAIQSDIAQTVALKLSARLSPEEQKEIGEKPTTDLEAYDLYLQAKEFVANWEYLNRPDNLPKAIKLLEEVTAKDPKFTLAYCSVARAHDDMYHYWFDRTPERRARADAAIDEALRLEPNRPEVHLAVAYHLYSSYRNFERASVQIALALRDFPNNPEALWLGARIDRRRGHWDESTKALEKSFSLDPRNPDIIYHLSLNYEVLRRYREAGQLEHRLSEIEPDNPIRKTEKTWVAYLRTGNATSYRAALDLLPSSIKDHGLVASTRFWFALYARDWMTAKQILEKNSDEDLRVGGGMKVTIPRGCGGIWLAALQGKHPRMETGFAAARDQLAQRFEARPEEVELLSFLGVVDAYLGRKDEAIQEATRAVEIRSVSEDAVEGPWILGNLALVYAWTNEPDLAFRELAILVETPTGLDTREIFKSDPTWDPIRTDPRFDKLVAQLPQRH